MVRDALRGYLSLASGLTEVTVGRATTAAKALVAQGEATAEQVSALADDLVDTSRRNREAIGTLVRYEVEQALRRLGLAPADEVVTLTERVRKLEATVRELRAEAARERPTATQPPAKRAKTAKPAKAAKSAPKKSAAGAGSGNDS
jgi:polyhydroxyalkanoate synthesis regulator phasin